MSLLIINTLEKNDPLAKEAIRNLSAQTSLYTIFHTMEMKIAPCIGCNACWLKTPGICAIKDDYEKILKACLQHDTTIIISDTSLGFINYKAKNIVDRMLPLATMYTHIINGQMRHIPRYEKEVPIWNCIFRRCGYEVYGAMVRTVCIEFQRSKYWCFSD